MPKRERDRSPAAVARAFLAKKGLGDTDDWDGDWIVLCDDIAALVWAVRRECAREARAGVYRALTGAAHPTDIVAAGDAVMAAIARLNRAPRRGR